jgi:hypothetical protein
MVLMLLQPFHSGKAKKGQSQTSKLVPGNVVQQCPEENPYLSMAS